MTQHISKYGNGRRIVIVDAGSTKTHARILSRVSGEVEETVSMAAVNPVHLSDEELDNRLSPLATVLRSDDDVAYFGAGCMPGMPSERVAASLRRIGATGSVTVDSDIVAAALALFGENEGIACILGTGSNTAYVSDGEVRSSVPSLGYVLGDEGSGAAIGRRLLRSVLRSELPQELTDAFETETSQTLSDVIENLYRRPTPNRYLAQFTYFVAKHIDIREIRQLVRDEFAALFVNQVTRYPQYRYLPIGFVGSVAKVFEKVLQDVAEEFECSVSAICESPMEGLIEYFNSTEK